MKKDYIIIFVLALILRIILALLIFCYFGEEGFITKDAVAHYLPLAKNFALGNGFTLDGVTPYAYKAPGYPLFLAFFHKIFGVFWPAIIVQIILSAFLAVLIFKIGEEIGFNRKINLMAGILTATAPHLIYYGTVYVTESLFAFFVAFRDSLFHKIFEGAKFKICIVFRSFFGP
jgi:4-amino-4-deoxy-L-arabinose transferase-like glycosyltransferase